VVVPSSQTAVSTLNVTSGKVYENATTPYGAVGVAAMTNAAGTVVDGSFRKLYVSSFAVTNGSAVMLTYKGSNSPFGYLRAENLNTPRPGQFRIVSDNLSDTNFVQWMVIN
jgi:hypothetical protein